LRAALINLWLISSALWFFSFSRGNPRPPKIRGGLPEQLLLQKNFS
jgi:hypothetical protein